MEEIHIKQFLYIVLGIAILVAIGGYMLYLDTGFDRGKITMAVSTSALPSAESTATPTFTDDSGEPMNKINLNTADVTELDSLPGIGPKLAERIIAYRSQTPFKVIYDLKKVSGIGDKTFQSVSDLICVN